MHCINAPGIWARGPFLELPAGTENCRKANPWFLDPFALWRDLYFLSTGGPFILWIQLNLGSLALSQTRGPIWTLWRGPEICSSPLQRAFWISKRQHVHLQKQGPGEQAGTRGSKRSEVVPDLQRWRPYLYMNILWPGGENPSWIRKALWVLQLTVYFFSGLCLFLHGFSYVWSWLSV